MNVLWHFTGSAAVILTLTGGPAWAQTSRDRSGASAIEELRALIRARDDLIRDLQQRLLKLEQQIGAAPAVSPPAPTAASARPEIPSAPAGAKAEPEPARTPTRPGQLEIDEGAVDRALQRALIETRALLLPAGMVEVEPSFFYQRREDDAPGLILENNQLIATANEVRRDEFETSLMLRLGLPFDSQVEVEVPYRYEDAAVVVREGFATRSEEDQKGRGLGDVRLAFAKSLLSEKGWRPDLTGWIEWDTETGQTDDGVALGSGFHEFTGSLTAAKQQEPLVFVGSLSYTTGLENDGIDPGDEVGLSLGTVLAASPETSLRFFINQSFAGEADVNGESVDGSDQVSTSLIIGTSSVLSALTVLDVQAGIGVTEDAPDYSIRVSLPIRFGLFN
jgi:hypothetical protein